MSLYRNIGPITFLNQSQASQIFTTQQYWLIQLKYAFGSYQNEQRKNPMGNKMLPCKNSQYNQVLQNISNKYNAYFSSKLLSMYSQFGKMPSLLMNRQQVQLYDLKSSKNIASLCDVCRVLIKSFQVLNVKSLNTKIQKNLLFRNLRTNEGFYIHIQKINRNSQEDASKEQQKLVQLIIEFLQQNFEGIMHISYKLLIKKLKKSMNLQQMKQELDYFKNVYQIGTNNTQKQNYQYNGALKLQKSQKNNQIVNKHRTYRKRSSQFHSQTPQQIIYKKVCSSEHKQNQKSHSMTRSSNNYQSVHLNSRQKLSPFFNKNKSSKAIHSNSNRYNLVGTLRPFKNTKKLFCSKSSSKDKNQSSSNPKYAKKLNLNKKFNNFLTNNNSPLNTHNLSKYKRSLQTINKDIFKQKSDINQTSNLKLQIKLKQNSVMENNKMQQILQTNLKLWKEKRAKNYLTHQTKNTQPQQNSKSIKRKHKNSKIDNQKLIEQCIDQIKKQKVMFKEVINNDENQIRHNRDNVSYNDVKKSRSDQIQQMKLVSKIQDNQQTIRPKMQKQAIKSKHQNERVYKMTHNQRQSCLKQPIKSKQSNKEEIEKQKTIRRHLNTSSIIQQNIVKNTRNRLQLINCIGQCVTRTPYYLSQLGNGDRYFWQLPAFLIYKQFYKRRLQIQQSLRSDCVGLKNQKSEAAKLLTQISQQNIQTKQSLIKLLKIAIKKIKKFNISPEALDQTRNCLNLDFSQNIKLIKRSYEIIANFIIELEDIRPEKPDLLSYQIYVIDAYMLLRGGQFNIEDRKSVNIQDYQNQNTQKYFSKRIKVLNKFINYLNQN